MHSTASYPVGGIVMSKQQNYQELYQLIGSLCNETITSAQHEQLQEILSKDAAARHIYFQYLDLHLELGQLQTEDNPELPNFVEPIASKRIVEKRTSMIGNQFSWVASLTLLAAIVVAVGISIDNQNPMPAPVVENKQVQPAPQENLFPTVVQTSQIRFTEGGATLRVGTQLEKDQQYALVEGELQLLFASGAEVIMEGPAIFVAKGGESLTVDYGACSVYAPEGAQGFVVNTPLSKVVDLGTRFSVKVHEGGETDVQVVEGEAVVHPAQSTNSSEVQALQLTQGMAKRFTQVDNLAVKEIRFDQSRYAKHLPDRVVAYTASAGKHDGCEDLTSVTVQRGGKQYEYQTEELIGVKVTYFNGLENTHCMTTALNDPDPLKLGKSRLSLLESDRSLMTGLINPGGSEIALTADPVMNSPEIPGVPNTPGMAVRFQQPVVNGPGPDVVLFDLHIIVHPVYGDPFHVSPVHFRPGLQSHSIDKFQINLSSAEALLLDKFMLYAFKNKIQSLDQLATLEVDGRALHVVRAKALATGIDLSDLGYKEGETVEELFIQDGLGEGGNIDPVFIAGLPRCNPSAIKNGSE